MNHKHSWRVRLRRAAIAAMLLATPVGVAAQGAAPGAAPAGQYKLDPYHASLEFRIQHLGLSNYVARFTRFDATLDWDPANPAASSITLSVEPASIRTDFSGDYKALHKGTPWSSFEESLSRDPKIFDTDKFPKATFQSTRVEVLRDGVWRVQGDLEFRGVKKPVSFDASLVGSVAKHMGTGKGALGLSAHGSIQRADFGMDFLLQPPLLGAEVGIQFEGEFSQSAP